MEELRSKAQTKPALGTAAFEEDYKSSLIRLKYWEKKTESRNL